MIGKDRNKDKEHQDGETATSGKTDTSPWDTCQSNKTSARIGKQGMPP